jgi:hypothetical protein
MTAAATATSVSAPRTMNVESATGLQHRRASSTSGDRDNGEAKHLAAVARSLGWADESAERGDHVDAVAWLEMVEAIDDELPEIYKLRRDQWRLACSADRPRG